MQHACVYLLYSWSVQRTKTNDQRVSADTSPVMEIIWESVTWTQRLRGGDIFLYENPLFTRQMNFPLLASRQNHPPNSRGQRIFPAIYFPDNTFSNQSPDPQVPKTPRQTPACGISKPFHFYPFFQKNIMRGIEPSPTPPMVTPLIIWHLY